MSQTDPYEILGVSRTATADEIKRAYRRLAKEHHPDRNRGDKHAEEQFKRVQAAYDVLGDEQRRAQYDRFGAGGPPPEYHRWQEHASAGGGEDVTFENLGDLSSIFEQFFSRGANTARARTGRRGERHAGGRESDGRIDYTVELSFEEALLGTTREVVLTGGGGRDEHITFRVPAGIGDGKKIRLAGKGGQTRMGRGDLIITVRLRPHAYFRRDGNDVYLEVPISVPEALLGARIEVPAPYERVLISVPAGTASGAKLRVRGKGVRSARDGTPGDFYAVIRIQPPRELSPAARRIAEELREELREDVRSSEPWQRGAP